MLQPTSLHSSDEYFGAGCHRRRIENNQNYKNINGLWLPSNPVIEQTANPPPGWGGAYEFALAARDNGIQLFAGDETDQQNSALVGLRMTDHPDRWLNLKALDLHNQCRDIDPSPNAVKWANPWDATTLEWTVSKRGVSKLITADTGAPNSFRFSLKLPAGHTCKVDDNCLVVADAQGAEWLRTHQVWAMDALENSVPSYLRMADPIGNYPVIEIGVEPGPEHVRPFRIDPQVVISGTSAIDDSYLYVPAPNYNYGGYVIIVANSYGNLLRLNSTTIPSGKIISGKISLYCSILGSSANTYFRKLVVGNAGWVEGTRGGAAQEGSNCYAYKAYSATTPVEWVDGPGVGKPANYDDEVLIDTIDSTGWWDLAISNSWFEQWKIAENNAGWYLVRPSAGTSRAFHSTEYVTDPDLVPYVTIDYSAGLGRNLRALGRR
jgi:hypothetical protein